MKRKMLQKRVLSLGMALFLFLFLNGCFWPFTTMDGELVRKPAPTPEEKTITAPENTYATEESLRSAENMDEEMPVLASLGPLPSTAKESVPPSAPEEEAPSAPREDQQAGRFKNNAIDNARAAGKPLLVDFYAKWCGPCMHMKPTLEKLGDKYADALNILFIDVDKHSALAQRHRADSIPLLLLYDANGSLISRLEGYMAEAELVRELQKVGIQ
ncbi:MAG TPA: thioredoxin family protein [Candidatus Hydrogenedentes bacterium]|nr:MAG: Thioredoxin-like protein [Candidatus Hydrogenedentes bacterium ADurb.Bin179]HOC70918.1 thioredoxin family protein [Candidatus Hydrogenedentota bacterium]